MDTLTHTYTNRCNSLSLTRLSVCLTVTCSSNQAVSVTHSYMFILPGCQFDSQLHVHLTRPSVFLTVTCFILPGRQFFSQLHVSSYQAVSFSHSYMFILPGRQFDLDGNLKPWWPKQVVDEFIRRAQCVVDQYSNYTVPKINLHVSKM